jgi:hypothetical protein
MHFSISPGGTLFHVLNLSIFLVQMLMMMFVYALIRPRFNSNVGAGLTTAAVFLFIGFMLLANLTNLGVLPVSLAATMILFSLLELPPALLVGAVLYGEG